MTAPGFEEFARRVLFYMIGFVNGLALGLGFAWWR